MKNLNNTEKARLLAMISRDKMDFIDKLSKDAQFSTGHKLTRQDVVCAILEAVASLPITGKDIHSKEELENHIEKAIREQAGKNKKGRENEDLH